MVLYIQYVCVDHVLWQLWHLDVAQGRWYHQHHHQHSREFHVLAETPLMDPFFSEDLWLVEKADKKADFVQGKKLKLPFSFQLPR